MHPCRRLAALAVLVAAFAAVSADEKPASDAPPKGVRVFTCAHSFHIFVANGLDQLAKREKIVGHKLAGAQMIGGSRVIQHWNLPEGKNKAKPALESGAVDVLTLSPHLALPDEGIDNFVELALKHNPKIRILVQLSWFPYDTLDKAGKVTKNDQRDGRTIAQLRPPLEQWEKKLVAQVKKLNEKHGKQAVFIVPVGKAVLRLRELVIDGKAPGIKKQSELFTDPIGHAKQPVMLLATYCYYSAIYGRKPRALPAGVTEGDKEKVALYRLLQDIAWETVRKYPYSGLGGEERKE